jgi:hypothetical protein
MGIQKFGRDYDVIKQAGLFYERGVSRNIFSHVGDEEDSSDGQSPLYSSAHQPGIERLVFNAALGSAT